MLRLLPTSGKFGTQKSAGTRYTIACALTSWGYYLLITAGVQTHRQSGVHQKLNMGPNSVRQSFEVQVGNPATLVVQMPVVLGRACPW
jgi:hypothetical protein